MQAQIEYSQSTLMNKLRVFLADDHEVVRAGLKLLISAQPDMEVVGEAGDGESAWREVKELRPDIVIMDVSMPQMNGALATERLKVDCPEVKVVALSATPMKSTCAIVGCGRRRLRAQTHHRRRADQCHSHRAKRRHLSRPGGRGCSRRRLRQSGL
jgi:chemotaxis response regulator CheB